MLQRHYPIPVVVLYKICKIPLYSCRRFLIRRKTLTSEEELEFWEEIGVRESQIWGIVWMFQQFIVQIFYFSHCQNTFVGGCIALMKDDFFFFCKPGLFPRIFCLVWLKDLNNIPRLLFYRFQDYQQTKCLQHPKTLMPWPFLLMESTLSSLVLNNRLLSTVLTAVWILVCNGESKSHPK